MPRKGGLSNIIRQLTNPNPRRNSMNRFNRQPRNMNRETPPVEPQANLGEREPLFGLFGPGPGPGSESGFGPEFGSGLFGPEQGSQEYGLFGGEGPRPIAETNNEGVPEGENSPLENENRNNGFSIF